MPRLVRPVRNGPRGGLVEATPLCHLTRLVGLLAPPRPAHVRGSRPGLLAKPPHAGPLLETMARLARRLGPDPAPLASELPGPSPKHRLAGVAFLALRARTADRVRRREPLGLARLCGFRRIGPGEALATVAVAGPRSALRRVDAADLVRRAAGIALWVLAPGVTDLRPGPLYPVCRPGLPAPSGSWPVPTALAAGVAGGRGPGVSLCRLAPGVGLCPRSEGRLAGRGLRPAPSGTGRRDRGRLLPGPALVSRSRGGPRLPRPAL